MTLKNRDIAIAPLGILIYIYFLVVAPFGLIYRLPDKIEAFNLGVIVTYISFLITYWLIKDELKGGKKKR